MATVKPDPPTGGTADAASSSPAALAVPASGRYEIDTGHSAVAFRTRHLFGLAPVRGSFAIRAGTVQVAGPVTGSRIHVEIETASFRTGNPQRDDIVRSARFLDASRYPVIAFKSERADGQALPGLLTVSGVTRPVSVVVEQIAVTPEGFTARGTARIDRAGFGVTAYRGLAGRHLDMTVEIRCVRN